MRLPLLLPGDRKAGWSLHLRFLERLFSLFLIPPRSTYWEPFRLDTAPVGPPKPEFYTGPPSLNTPAPKSGTPRVKDNGRSRRLVFYYCFSPSPPLLLFLVPLPLRLRDSLFVKKLGFTWPPVFFRSPLDPVCSTLSPFVSSSLRPCLFLHPEVTRSPLF